MNQPDTYLYWQPHRARTVYIARGHIVKKIADLYWFLVAPKHITIRIEICYA
jgi:hypothetical protein